MTRPDAPEDDGNGHTSHFPFDARFLEKSPYQIDLGEIIGRDPREIIAGEWAGRERLVGLRAIRAKCYDCACGSWPEVRKCRVVDCPLWPLRMGCVPKGLTEASVAE